ncbi:MAG: 5'-deoxynucleotidase [Clostridiales bacterium]|nr:5'-deoxynucleotidase [Candidatus Coliplasma caballi]
MDRMNHGFFAMAFRMKYIQRWGLMYSVHHENLSTHSLEVGVCAHALAVIGNTYFGKRYDPDRIASKGMFHDLPEIFTGDIPTPVKYFSDETKQSYSAVEDAALARLYAMLPAELRPSYEELFRYTPEEKRLIKAADKICALLKCRDEAHFGNPEFAEAEKTLLDSLAAMRCEEAEHFMQTFGDSFSQPIDTLLSK